MEFTELVATVGLEKAVALLEGCLPPDFWEGLTFKQCLEIADGHHVPQGSIDSAQRRMLEIGSFDDWLGLGHSIDAARRKTALDQVVRLARTLEQWNKVLERLENTRADCVGGEIALGAMKTTAWEAMKGLTRESSERDSQGIS